MFFETDGKEVINDSPFNRIETKKGESKTYQNHMRRRQLLRKAELKFHVPKAEILSTMLPSYQLTVSLENIKSNAKTQKKAKLLK